jgi:hypothetical protein
VLVTTGAANRVPARDKSSALGEGEHSDADHTDRNQARDKLTDDGRQRLVRHGHLPEREIMTGIGPVAVRCPRVRGRVGEGSERIHFSSAILPPYARRSKSLEDAAQCLLVIIGATPEGKIQWDRR